MFYYDGVTFYHKPDDPFSEAIQLKAKIWCKRSEG